MTYNTQGCRIRGSHARSAGFSLIEIMIVVVIIGILASIALPSYNDYTLKTRRAAGTSCVTAAAQQMERFYTTNLTYVGAPAASVLDDICEPTTLEFYDIALNPAPAARTYTVTAAPKGDQSSDPCGTLSINEAGTKTPSTAGCW